MARLRAWVLVWSQRRHLLAWLSVHNAALERLGGIPATIRVDNEKIAAQFDDVGIGHVWIPLLSVG